MSTEARTPTESRPAATLAPRLNVTAAAKILGIDRATVYRLCRARRIRLTGGAE